MERQKFIDNLSLLELQNLNGREDIIEAFEKGIGVAYDELVKKSSDIHPVSDLPDDDTIELLYDNGAHTPFYDDILEEVGQSAYHFINGMKALRNILLAPKKGDR